MKTSAKAAWKLEEMVVAEWVAETAELQLDAR